jgi:ureidoglycolate lyase
MLIHVNELSSELFAPYGSVLGQPQVAQPSIQDAVSDVWLGFSSLMGIGSEPGKQVTYLRIHTRPQLYDKMEKHDTSAEAFIPLDGRSILVVAPPGPPGDAQGPDMSRARAFMMDGTSGVLLMRGTWHAVPYNLSNVATYLVLVDDRIIASGDLHVTPVEPMEFDLSHFGGR